MKINITDDQTVVLYDANIISKIREMIEAGLVKLKSFFKFKSNNLDFYNDIKDRFNQIALKLEDLELWDELNYFLSVSNFIKYIVYHNSISPSFGHCSFAVELLEFFIDYIKVNFDYYLDLTQMTLEEFKLFQDEIRRGYRKYRRKFFTDIYELSGDYTQEQLYKIHESLRG